MCLLVPVDSFAIGEEFCEVLDAEDADILELSEDDVGSIFCPGNGEDDF